MAACPVPLDEELAWIDAERAEMLDLDRVLEELEAARPAKMPDGRAAFLLGIYRG